MQTEDSPALPFGDARVPARVWAKINIAPDGCWMWTGATGGGTYKYGVASLDGRIRLVHRWMYGVAVRPAADGEHVHHECRVPLCVNPAHLQALPVAEHIGQWHRDKTHCPHGHLYDEANTYFSKSPKGGRNCRTCGRERARRNKKKGAST
jgi:hypothetical protein